MPLIQLQSVSKSQYFVSEIFFNPLDANSNPIDMAAINTFPDAEGIEIAGWPRLSFYFYNGAAAPVGLVSTLEINPTRTDNTKWVSFGASITAAVNGVIPLDRVARRIRYRITGITSGGVIGILVGSHS